MLLPYLQIDQDFMGPKATLIAARLKVTRHQAIGMGADLFAFAINMTSKDDSPPTGLFDYADAAGDLEFAMGWTGESGKAVDAFIRAGVIERRGEGFRVCGTSRYERTWKKNRHAWNRDNGQQPPSGMSDAAEVPQSGSNAAQDAPPSGKKAAAKVPEDEDEDEEVKEEEKKENKQHLSNAPDGDSTKRQPRKKNAHPEPPTPEELEVFDYWRTELKRPGSKLDAKRLRVIRAQLEAGRTVADLKRAIDGCALSAWHNGRNPDGKRYTDLELILRDAKHVEEFMATADATAPPAEQPEHPCAKCGGDGRYVTWGGIRICPGCAAHVARQGLESEAAVRQWISEENAA